MLGIQAWIVTSYPPLHRLRGEILFDNHIVAWAEAKFMQGVPNGK
jgi:hypothetical protein